MPWGVGDVVGVGEGDGDGDAVVDGVGDGDGEEEGEGDGDGEGFGDGDGDGEGFGDGVGEGFGDGVGEGFGELVTDGAGVGVGETADGWSVGDGIGVPGVPGEPGVLVTTPGRLGEKLTLTPALEALDLIASLTFPEHPTSVRQHANARLTSTTDRVPRDANDIASDPSSSRDRTRQHQDTCASFSPPFPFMTEPLPLRGRSRPRSIGRSAMAISIGGSGRTARGRSPDRPSRQQRSG